MKRFFQALKSWVDELRNPKGAKLLHLYKDGALICITKTSGNTTNQQLKVGQKLKGYLLDDLQIGDEINISGVTEKNTSKIGLLRKAYLKQNILRLCSDDDVEYMIEIISY